MYRCDNGEEIYLIDTPGFDDSHNDNVRVLEQIVGFLCTFYSRDYLRIVGVIYFQRISDVRMSGSSVKSLRIFERLCGSECFPKVVIATTFWGLLQDDTSTIEEDRERNLSNDPQFCGTLVQGGARMVRHTNTYDSARAIVESMLRRYEPLVLRIQKEIVDHDMALAETGVGQFLEGDLLALRERYHRTLEELGQELEEAVAEKQDEEVVAIISEERKAYEERIEQNVLTQRSLFVSFEDMIRKQQKWLASGADDAPSRSSGLEGKSDRELKLEEQLERIEMDHIREINLAKRDKELELGKAFQRGYEAKKNDIMQELRKEKRRQEKSRPKPEIKPEAKPDPKPNTLKDLLQGAVINMVEFFQNAPQRSRSHPRELVERTRQGSKAESSKSQSKKWTRSSRKQTKRAHTFQERSIEQWQRETAEGIESGSRSETIAYHTSEPQRYDGESSGEEDYEEEGNYQPPYTYPAPSNLPPSSRPYDMTNVRFGGPTRVPPPPHHNVPRKYDDGRPW